MSGLLFHASLTTLHKASSLNKGKKEACGIRVGYWICNQLVQVASAGITDWGGVFHARTTDSMVMQ